MPISGLVMKTLICPLLEIGEALKMISLAGAGGGGGDGDCNAGQTGYETVIGTELKSLNSTAPKQTVLPVIEMSAAVRVTRAPLTSSMGAPFEIPATTFEPGN